MLNETYLPKGNVCHYPILLKLCLTLPRSYIKGWSRGALSEEKNMSGAEGFYWADTRDEESLRHVLLKAKRPVWHFTRMATIRSMPYSQKFQDGSKNMTFLVKEERLRPWSSWSSTVAVSIIEGHTATLLLPHWTSPEKTGQIFSVCS